MPALVNESASDLISGYHLALLRPRSEQIMGGYLLRALQSKSLAYQFCIEAKGVTRYGLSHAGIKSIWILLPPIIEQTAIVRYLNYTTERIQSYINAKERLINLLEEQRQAIIQRAVTRGLDPNVRLKPSGIEWLGEVPVHWHIRRLKWLIRCRSGDGISTEDVASKKTIEKSFPVIGGNGTMGFGNSTNCNQIALAIGRVGALCGNVHIIKPPVWITDNALVISADLNLVSIEYLATILKTRNLNELADKTAQPLITGTRIKNEYIPFPPPPEQTAIVEYLEKATADIDSATHRARREIELLKEYHTRLSADVVTGKLDVREAAFKLPEAHDELSISDKPELQSD